VPRWRVRPAPMRKSSAATRLCHRPPEFRGAAADPRQCFANHRRGIQPDHMNISLGKAGRTAGLAADLIIVREMNPVDHPHGGGEGRTSGDAIR